MRHNYKTVEQYYWILYYAFLSPQEAKYTEGIIDNLETHIINSSYCTYYRKQHEAIEALSAILWGAPRKRLYTL